MSLLRPGIIKQHNPNPISHQRDETVQLRSNTRKGKMTGWIGTQISGLKMLHLPLNYWKMPPSRVGWQNEYVKHYIPTQTPEKEKWPSNHHADRQLYVGPDTWSYFHYRSMQTSLNITKDQTLNPIRTSKHCEVLIRWTQLNEYVVRKNNLILIMEICS